jgi:hypothetical protein
MERDDMPSTTSPDTRAADERGPRKEILSTPPLPQGGPPNLRSGLELPRSSDC